MKKPHISVQINNRIFLLKAELKKAVFLFLKAINAVEIKRDKGLTQKQFRKEYLKGKSSSAINLRAARRRKGLSQVKLAAVTGLDRSNLNSYENGKKKIGKKVALKLAQALNTDYRIFLAR